MKKVVFCVAALLFCFPLNVMANDNGELNETFVIPGKPFEALQEEIDTLKEQIEVLTEIVNTPNDEVLSLPFVKDATGETLGTYLNSYFGFFDPGFNILTPENYNVSVSVVGEVKFEGFFYTTNDCSGTPYTILAPQSVFAVEGELYYVPKGTIPEVVDIYSSSAEYPGFPASCMQFFQTMPALSPAFPNDPQITGVNSYTFMPPLVIESE